MGHRQQLACPGSPAPPLPGPPAAPCKLDLLLLSQPVANLSEAWLYPVNAMRIRPVANARTLVGTPGGYPPVLLGVE